MSSKTLVWAGLGSVIGLMALVLVIVLPASEDQCADQPSVPSIVLPGDPLAMGASNQLSGSGTPSAGASAMGQTGANYPAAAVNPTVAATPSLAAGVAPIRRTWPLAAGSFTISDTFGARGGAHLGVDMAAADGTPIFSVADGIVVAAGPASGFGNWIVIDSIDINGRPFSAVYGHEWDSGVLVRVGQTVRAGQPIGTVGSAGESSGPHLHFEIVPGGRFTGGRQIDPLPWLDGAPTPNAGGAWPFSTNPLCSRGFGTAGGALAAGKVPPELEIWYRRAGSLCPEITPSILAAQGRQESGFRRGLTSPAGAQGLSQFLPGTARATDPDDGKPYLLDADGNGSASIWDDGDAIIAQGRYMCSLAHRIERWIGEGRVHGDVVPLALAAYNAGEGAVLASGGMPNQVAAHFSETRPYVTNILAMEAQYRAPGSMGRFQPDGEAGGAQVVEAARQWLGTPYVWGGGGPQGPTDGGLDGPGLTSAAVFAASSGRVLLPRTAEQQWEMGAEVPIRKARPGDLVFTRFGPRGPADVGVYTGDGTMIRAADPTGVREVPVPGDARVRRVL
ncbi:peptidoglycan DD-metalloendopeptidase family protein [Nocardia transvalensis]|uniref:peptidoglycan DD-metalloendopeptidase family protein n=1 Tax=Nocardia transvalensis TaxID=37333 RepID=UPI0018953361|nr:peptidoglycan DD-metalloendopeptidase family protein [Nocardia transvalensis]MBF6332082.1 peptidoglycan DD-metalloendopeptidase family protein [Nocardia transvalensis]